MSFLKHIDIDSFCCCWGLRPGALATAAISIFIHGLNWIICLSLLKARHFTFYTVMPHRETFTIFQIIVGICFVLFLTSLVIDVVLIVGVLLHRPHLVRSWLIWSAITISLAMTFQLGLLVWTIVLQILRLIILGIFGLCFSATYVYLILVVHGFYKVLINAGNNIPSMERANCAQEASGISAGFTATEPTVPAIQFPSMGQGSARSPRRFSVRSTQSSYLKS